MKMAPQRSTMLKKSFYIFLLTSFLFNIEDVQARDTRKVSEPVTPKACTTLQADNKDSTSRIQSALKSCGSGKGVLLSASGGSNTFYSGPLTIPSGVSLIIGANTYLKALTNPASFDKGDNTCGTLDSSGKGCNPLILMKKVTNSGIYGPGTIDGQGGSEMTGKGKTWWELATEAKDKDKKQNNPRLIEIDNSKDVVLYKIVIKNSPNFHVVIEKSDGLTAWGITIDTPSTARNTDGFDPAGSKNILLTNSKISTGDDNVAIKGGSAASSSISILNNTFGVGHGMSIGSETTSGVSDVTVENLNLKGTTNGLRIKSDSSRGGKVTNIVYNMVCMEDVKNPIVVDTKYSSSTGSHIPDFQGITFKTINVKDKGKFVFNGYSDSHPIKATLENFHIKKGSKWTASHAQISGSALEDSTGVC